MSSTNYDLIWSELKSKQSQNQSRCSGSLNLIQCQFSKGRVGDFGCCINRAKLDSSEIQPHTDAGLGPSGRVGGEGSKLGTSEFALLANHYDWDQIHVGIELDITFPLSAN